jgi:hypothetical protein
MQSSCGRTASGLVDGTLGLGEAVGRLAKERHSL